MEMVLKSNKSFVLGDVVCFFQTNADTKIIVLTNNSKNVQGLLNIKAYYYEKKEDKLYLEPIEDKHLYLGKMLLINWRRSLNNGRKSD